MALQTFAFTAGYNAGQWGWTDDFYFQQDEAEGAAGLRAAAASFWTQRRLGMSADAALQFVRIGRLAQNVAPGPVALRFKAAKPVLLLSPSQLGIPKEGEVKTEMLNPWNAALAIVFAGGGGLRRPWLIRGIPTTFSSTTPADNPLFPTALLLTWFNNMLRSCLSQGAGSVAASPFVGNFGMKVISRPLAPTPVPLVTDVGVTPQGYLKYYFLTQPPFIVGDAVQVSGLRLSCGKGTNGLTTIKAGWVSPLPNNDTHVGTGFLQTYKRWCCQGEPFAKNDGIMVYQGQAFAAFDRYQAGAVGTPITGGALRRMVNRKTGRPFDGTAGRGKACCG